MEPKTSYTCVPLRDAMALEKLDSHTYRVNLDENYCSNSVPNGGYAASCMLAAANAHLASRGQPDTLTAHFEYPARISPGPAMITIEDIKIGHSLLCTLHLTMWQHGLQPQKPWIAPQVSQRVILAYSTHTNLRTMEGLSVSTAFEAAHADAPSHSLPDFEMLKATGVDVAWAETLLPASSASTLLSLRNWHFYLPRGEAAVPGTLDMWLRLASGERITQAVLPYVVDSFPFNLSEYIIAPEVKQMLRQQGLLMEQQKQPSYEAKATSADGTAQKGEESSSTGARASLWLPTVVMNLEVKTALPDEGVEWIAVRIVAKEMKNGRFDMEVIVRDTDDELIALSHHVALMLDVERAARSKTKSKSKASL
ncbi:thioesterase family protein [Xylariaceae sp. FL1272]|nr:thioesterase family protein [Xylariaceae sp. FL1272]